MTIGQRIKEIRKQKGLTQKQVGERIGTTASFIGQYENGARLPKYETLIKIARALDVSIYALDPILSIKGNRLTDLPEYMQDIIKIATDGDLSRFEAEVDYLLFDEEGKKHLQESLELFITEKKKQDGIKKRLDDAFNSLTSEGQLIAAERVEELAEIPRYQAKSSEEMALTPEEKDPKGKE